MRREERCEKVTFQLQLLLKVEEMQQYPFTKMVINQGLTEKEYQETIRLLEELLAIYQCDIEHGLLNHTQLLFHFAGMLCPKLPIEASIQAMYEEGVYSELAEKLMELIETLKTPSYM